MYNHPGRNPEDETTLDILCADLDQLNLSKNYENIRRERAADLSNSQRPSSDYKPLPSNSRKKFTEIFSESQPGELIADQTEAKEEVYKFFKNLYKHETESDEFAEFVDFPLPQVSPQENTNLTKIITTEEIHKIQKS